MKVMINKIGRSCSNNKNEKQYSFCNFKAGSLLNSKGNKPPVEYSSYTDAAMTNTKGNDRVQHDAGIRRFMK